MKYRYVAAEIYFGEKLVRAFVGPNDQLEDLLVAYTEILSVLPDRPHVDVRILSVYGKD